MKVSKNAVFRMGFGTFDLFQKLFRYICAI